MEEHDASQGPAHADQCRDTRTFDRLLLAYFLGIIVLSFYVLISYQ